MLVANNSRMSFVRIDADECLDGSDNCHPSLATCSNLPGSFECTCNAGYTGNGI